MCTTFNHILKLSNENTWGSWVLEHNMSITSPWVFCIIWAIWYGHYRIFHYFRRDFARTLILTRLNLYQMSLKRRIANQSTAASSPSSINYWNASMQKYRDNKDCIRQISWDMAILPHTSCYMIHVWSIQYDTCYFLTSLLKIAVLCHFCSSQTYLNWLHCISIIPCCLLLTSLQNNQLLKSCPLRLGKLFRKCFYQMFKYKSVKCLNKMRSCNEWTCYKQ